MRGTVTYEALSSVLAHYQGGDWQADIAVVTGDLIQDDSPGAYVHFRDMLSELQMPVHCVPGNHDVRALMRSALAEAPFHYCASIEYGEWLIIGLDSCINEYAGGSVSEAEFNRLDQALEHSAAPHAMVCLHHPPVAMGSRWLDSVGLDNGEETLRRLSTSGKVRLALFGHVHQNYEADHENIRIIATPSTCSQFAASSDEFAIDDKPPAYRRLQLNADGSHSNELIWIA